MTTLNKHTGMPYLPRDISMRLSGSLIRYKEEPFYIRDTSEDGLTLHGFFPRTGGDKSVKLPCKDLNIRPVPLGYINGNTKCWYVTRQPTRRYKQGLESRTLNIKGPQMRMPVSDFLTCRGFSRGVKGDYPTFDHCLKAVKSRKISRAFSRRFCLSWNEEVGEVSICHRGTPVGYYRKGGADLFQKFGYLLEEWEHSL